MDLRDVEKAATDQGWRVERNKRGHPVFYPPDPSQPCVVGSGTPGDQRALNNLLSRLRRGGLKWPWTGEDRRKSRKS